MYIHISWNSICRYPTGCKGFEGWHKGSLKLVAITSQCKKFKQVQLQQVGLRCPHQLQVEIPPHLHSQNGKWHLLIPSTFPKSSGKNPKATTKVTLNEAPIRFIKLLPCSCPSKRYLILLPCIHHRFFLVLMICRCILLVPCRIAGMTQGLLLGYIHNLNIRWEDQNLESDIRLCTNHIWALVRRLCIHIGLWIKEIVLHKFDKIFWQMAGLYWKCDRCGPLPVSLLQVVPASVPWMSHRQGKHPCAKL